MILFDDIEMLLPQMLRDDLSIPAGRTLPRSYAGGNYVTIRRQGGVRRVPVIDTVRIGVNIYSDNDKNANDLAIEVRAILETYENVGPFKRIRTNGINEVPHEDNHRQRYFTAEIDMRGYEAGTGA